MKKIKINLSVIIMTAILSIVTILGVLIASNSTLSSVDTHTNNVSISKKGASWDEVKPISNLQ